MSNVGNVTVTGETEDIAIEYTVAQKGTGSGKILVYVNDVFEFSIHNTNISKTYPLRKGDTLSIRMYAGGGNCIESVNINGKLDTSIPDSSLGGINDSAKPSSKIYEYTYDSLMNSEILMDNSLSITVTYKVRTVNLDPCRIKKITANRAEINLYDLLDPSETSFDTQFKKMEKKMYSPASLGIINLGQAYFVYAGNDYYVKIDSKKDIKVLNSSDTAITFVKCDEFSTATYTVYKFTMPDISIDPLKVGITIDITY